MKNMKYGRTLLALALVLVVLGSVVGGTIAWFTDNVESTNNVIQSGNLDIDIELKDGDKWISLEKNPNTKVYDYNLWEPGFTQVETMKIVNKGNLALEYELHVTPGDDEKLGANGESLAKAIDVYMAFGEKEATAFEDISKYKDAPDYQNGWWYCGTLDKMIEDEKGFTQGIMLPSGETDAPDGVLEVGKMQGSCTCTVALHMQEEAGNEFQNLSLGTVGFKLQAKQYTYEEDSFGDQYDKDAEYGEGSVISGLPYATVQKLLGDDLKIHCTDKYQALGLQFLDGDYTLACGLEMKANETEEDIIGKDYADWSVDFEIISTKAISEYDLETHIYLAGHYDFLDLAETGDWIAFGIQGFDVTANKAERVMSAFARMKYEEIVKSVKEFKCGVIFPEGDDYFKGESITLKLCVYETDGHGNELENGRHEIKSFKFDF